MNNANINNNGRGIRTHEIPADPPASENVDVRDETTSQNGDDARSSDPPGDGCNGDRERGVNKEEDGWVDDRSAAKEGGHIVYAGENDKGDYPSAYTETNNESKMFDQPPNNNHVMYEYNPNINSNGGGGPRQFSPPPSVPPFDPLQRPPFNLPASFPLSPINCLGPPNLPPMLPPPPPSLSLPPSVAGDPRLDATRQYYEARMREHALQYANAAAGAAWAAARIACGGMPLPENNPHHGPLGGMAGGWSGHPSAAQSYYTLAPASAMENGTTMSHMNLNQAAPSAPRQQKRTLWQPHSSSEGKGKSKGKGKGKGGPLKVPKKGGPNYPEDKSKRKNATALGGRPEPPPPPAPPNEKKRSKREIRGNDSVSSLGSESRDRPSAGRGHGKDDVNHHNRNAKKGKQRRRFNEDTAVSAGSDACGGDDVGNDVGDDNGGNKGSQKGNLRQKRGLPRGHSSRGSISSLGSGAGPRGDSVGRGRDKKKGRSAGGNGDGDDDGGGGSPDAPVRVHLAGLIGKNGGAFLFLSQLRLRSAPTPTTSWDHRRSMRLFLVIWLRYLHVSVLPNVPAASKFGDSPSCNGKSTRVTN